MPDYIRFKEFDPKDGRLTKVWLVEVIEMEMIIGHVSWYSGWRKYAFFPNSSTVYEQYCLRKIADFIEQQTKQHKIERSKHHGRTVEVSPSQAG